LLVPWELLREEGGVSSSQFDNLLEVAATDPLIFDEVIRGILHSDSCIRIQAANMVEKITRMRPLFLSPYKRVLLKEIAEIGELEVRLQVALLYGRVFWDEWDMKQAVALLRKWIESGEEDNLTINAIQSLHTLARQKAWIRPTFEEVSKMASEHNSLPVRELVGNLQYSFI